MGKTDPGHRATEELDLSLPDFLKVTEVAIENLQAEGIYNVCDDEPITLQDLLDHLAEHWVTKYRGGSRRLPFV